MHYKIIESLLVVGTLYSGVARMRKLCGDSVHTFSACVTLCLLGELGHAPAMKIFYTLRSLLRPFLPQIPFFQSYLYAHFTFT